jgi:phage shock protein PspC (stress-responsive transcriptional regulator)
MSEERVACPYCRELILPGAIKCKECGSNLSKRGSGIHSAAQALNFSGRTFDWTRNQPNRKVFGVAACIANNLRVSATLVRLIFVLLTFVSLLGLILYIALAAIIPPEPGTRSLFEAGVDSLGTVFDSFHGRQPATAASAPANVPAASAVVPDPPTQTDPQPPSVS